VPETITRGPEQRPSFFPPERKASVDLDASAHALRGHTARHDLLMRLLHPGEDLVLAIGPGADKWGCLFLEPRQKIHDVRPGRERRAVPRREWVMTGLSGLGSHHLTDGPTRLYEWSS